MPKKTRHIEVVPVWRETVDRKMLLRALLAFVAQLAEEAESAAAPATEQEVPRG